MKKIIRNQISNTNVKTYFKDVTSPIPDSIISSVHKKQKFDSLKRPDPPESMMYSKSDLLRMILDNDQKQSILSSQGPVIGVTEAIHGTYKTNFEMPKKDQSKVGLPLGLLNESPKAKQAIFARE